MEKLLERSFIARTQTVREEVSVGRVRRGRQIGVGHIANAFLRAAEPPWVLVHGFSLMW
jgi:hypothetical protein